MISVCVKVTKDSNNFFDAKTYYNISATKPEELVWHFKRNQIYYDIKPRFPNAHHVTQYNQSNSYIRNYLHLRALLLL